MFQARETLALLLAGALSLAVGCGTPSSGAGSGPMAPAEAHALVASGATLLDVRTPGEWAGGHIAGAVLVPVGELDARLSEIPRDHPVVVYCASGVRSASATRTLLAAGFDAHDLGGMSRWDQ